MGHTRKALKVWSLVEFAILPNSITGTGTRQATAVFRVTLSESRTVELTSCMSYKNLLIAILAIAVTAALVGYRVFFFECIKETL